MTNGQQDFIVEKVLSLFERQQEEISFNYIKILLIIAKN